MRLQTASIALGCLLLSACGGPLISHQISPGPASIPGTAHGTYCLPRHLLVVTVTNGVLDDELKKPYALISSYGATTLFARRLTEEDSSRLYQLGYNESSLSNDTIKVEYDGHCLLKRVSSRVRDESPSVIRDLASTVIQGVSGAPTARVTRSRSGTAGAAEPAPEKITLMLDVGPATYRKEQDRLNAALDAYKFDIAVEIKPLGEAPPQAAAPVIGDVEGIFYAPPRPYVLSVLGKRADGKRATIDERIFYSANGVPPQYVAIDRSAFVERYTEILFRRGLPHSIVTTKPSEAKEFATIPLDITTAILRAPVEAVRWDSEEVAARAELYKNQEILLQRQMKLIEAQDNLLKFLQDKKSVTMPTNIDDPVVPREEARQTAAETPVTEPQTNNASPPGPASDEAPDGNDSAPPD
jgi:hypothetical protein